MERSDLVVLAGGITVLLPAILLALSLEDRGFRLTARADGRLEVQPARSLTADDCRLIRRHRDELLRIVQYEPPKAN
jgi:hypothetical protein